MHKINMTYYIATAPNHNGTIIPLYDSSIESIKEEIDKSNNHCIENGWNPHQYLICECHMMRLFDDNGEFICSSETEMVIEKYPEVI